jgi:hypothetical protein
MDWQMLEPAVAFLLGWLAWSLVVGVMWAIFASGAFRKARRLPVTRAGLRAWVAGGGPLTRCRAKGPPNQDSAPACSSPSATQPTSARGGEAAGGTGDRAS